MGRATYQRGLGALSSQILQVPKETMERRERMEEAYTRLRGELGRPGTYEEVPPGEVAPIEGAAPEDQPAQTALANLATMSPEALTAYQKTTPEFQTMSRLTAEAQQLVAREGPLWEEMQQSVMGPIIEGSAAMLRDQSEVLRNEFARGGMRRSQAREAMLQMRNIEAANVQRGQQLWNASLALNQWARSFANEQITNYNKLYAENAGGIRDSFQDAMDKAGDLLVNSSIPIAANISTYAMAAGQAKHQENRDKANRIYKIAGSALGAIAGGVIGGPIGETLMTNAIGAGMSTLLPGAGFEALTGPGPMGVKGSRLEGLLGGPSIYDIPGPATAEVAATYQDVAGGTEVPERGLGQALLGLGEPGLGALGKVGGAIGGLVGVGEPGLGTVGKIGGKVLSGISQIGSLFGGLF